MQRRRLGQGTLAAFAWILFAYYWWLVGHRRLNPETITALVILFVLVAAVFLTTLLWIRHNKRIARRAGNRRKDRRPVTPPGKVDTLGRTLVDSGGTPLTEAVYIEIGIDEEQGIKRYETMDAPPPGGRR